MRFNLIYDFHKNPNWEEFYFEYIELKHYLKNARKFFNKQVKYECQRHPSNKELQNVRDLELENIKKGIEEQNKHHETNHHNKNHTHHNGTKSISTYVTVLNEAKKFENMEKFSHKCIKKFKNKLKRVENFFLAVKDDIKLDFEILKHLVIECEDIEKFKDQNVIANLQSIKHDYSWRESKEGDEISCRLAFIHLYKLLSVLERFTEMNKVAAKEIIFKYEKHFPEDLKTADELNNILSDFNEVILREENLKEDILIFYAEQFFRGDVNIVMKEFEINNKLNKKSKFLIAQIIAIPILLLIFFLLTYLVKDKDKFTIDKIHVFFPAFSFTLMVTLIFIYLPLIIIIFKKYKINYIYLLEIDPELLYSPEELLKYSLSMLIVWEFVLIAYRISLSYFYPQMHDKLYLFSVIILCLFFCFTFWPFRGLLRKLRICFFIIVIKCLCPVTRKGVKFRDFLFADIFSSFSLALGNLTAALCIIYTPHCRETISQDNCLYTFFTPIAFFFPKLIRILQCANLVYYGQKVKIESVNILKYVIHGGDLVLGWMLGRNYIPVHAYILVTSFSSTFLVAFDMIIDWNVWKINSKNFLLRDKLTYPKWFYYFAMVVNLVLRYFWFMSLVLPLEKDWIYLISNFLEIYRRAQWVLIRVENEQLYNLEGYRKYLPIPRMPLH